MIAIPLMTAKVLSGKELQSKTYGFRKQVIIARYCHHTGTDAYLLRDERSMHCMIPSNTIINTAGPEQLSASKSGLLSMYLKDSKGNLHQTLAKNALVVQGLSQNLTSHT